VTVKWLGWYVTNVRGCTLDCDSGNTRWATAAMAGRPWRVAGSGRALVTALVISTDGRHYGQVAGNGVRVGDGLILFCIFVQFGPTVCRWPQVQKSMGIDCKPSGTKSQLNQQLLAPATIFGHRSASDCIQLEARYVTIFSMRLRV